MACNWTDAQRKAIMLRDQTVLVSAAAGSGKTSVLTERIIRRLLDAEHPASLDRLLIVTFTRAAAAQMKEKIGKALSNAMAEHPDDDRLSRQLFLLGSAQISTIDAFFQKTVREHFDILDLPASFRIAGEEEIKPIAIEVMREVVSEFYQRNEISNDGIGGIDPFARLHGNSFAEFIDHFLSGKTSSRPEEKIYGFYQVLSSYPNGVSLLSDYTKRLHAESGLPFLETKAGNYLKKQWEKELSSFLKNLDTADRYLQIDPGASSDYVGYLSNDRDTVVRMLDALRENQWESFRAVSLNYQTKKMPSGSKYEQMTREVHSFFRTHKAICEFIKANNAEFLSWTEEQIREQMCRTATVCETLFELLEKFESDFMSEKKSRQILEFNDLRTALYRFLSDPMLSDLADSLRARYDEIYIDEYQDVDEMQDKIFSGIKKDRRFMVGDVKQCIYRFRGSDPTIFTSYKNQMRNSDLFGECVFMSDNFRCDRSIISFTNRICSRLFSACEESVGYCPEDDLVCSKWNGEEEPPAAPVTVRFFEKKPKDDGTAEEAETDSCQEAEWVADEIKRLVSDETAKKKYGFDEIAILLRNRTKVPSFVKALEARSIPANFSESNDLLHAPRMIDLLNLLYAIDNPYRDIPLSEYLLTDLGHFTLEELSDIRLAASDQASLFEAMELVSKTPDHPLCEKAGAWIGWLDPYRRMATALPADAFLRTLYRDPILQKESTSPEFLFLYEQARTYQKISWCGLYGFLNRMQEILQNDKISAGGFSKSEKAVSITTIHQSKGLEFPVVFVGDCGKNFRKDSSSNLIDYHPAVGFSCKLYSTDADLSETTILRSACTRARQDDGMEEEIRILYVALTRAKERLYVTGTFGAKTEKVLEDADKILQGSRSAILGGKSYAAWILALWDEEMRNFADLQILPYQSKESLTENPVFEPVPLKSYSPDMEPFRQILEAEKQKETAGNRLRSLPTKVAASRISPDLLDRLLDETDETAALEEEIRLMEKVVPEFDGFLRDRKKPTPAEIGTATHAVLQFCDFQSLRDQGVSAELSRLVEKKFLSQKTADLVRLDWLEAFRKSELQKMILSASRVRRELQFSFFLPLSELTQDPGLKKRVGEETIFVQGSIDLLLETADGKLILCDYKTDHITAYEKEHPESLCKRLGEAHGEQLSVYARAVRQLFGKEPDGILIYSLPLGDSLQIL